MIAGQDKSRTAFGQRAGSLSARLSRQPFWKNRKKAARGLETADGQKKEEVKNPIAGQIPAPARLTPEQLPALFRKAIRVAEPE